MNNFLLMTTYILYLVTAGGWGTHIYVCVRDGEWWLLILGCAFFPFGAISGVGIWFGWW